MKQKIRRLLRFRENKRRKKLARYADVPRKFTKIFLRTSYYLKKSHQLEKKSGALLRSDIQSLILAWAREILGIVDVDLEIRGKLPDSTQPVLFVGNHVSYLDIPLLMASVPVVFVSKEEVSKWLVIGPASKRAGTVFVKRESGTSRAKTAEAIASCILEHKRSLAIFPSGTTTMDESKPWRSGAFKIAAKHKIPVQPFRLTYEPLRRVAYIDQDFFPTHLWQLLGSEKRVKAILEFGEIQMIDDPALDCEALQAWSKKAHHTRTQDNKA